MKTYQEAIDWLFEQFPAYQKVGVSAYKPDLDNILSLCAQLQIDFHSLKCIHVAGTNGKGSTSNMLASIFTQKGFRTGLFTSPHITDFRERIRVNGIEIPEQQVVDFCLEIQQLKLEVAPSFFEITWALALRYFLAENCDYCIIETGLGGRLDATNILSPILSIITNIGLDHVAILGDSLEKIAFEKAGIIKSKTPVVIGETLPESKAVFLEKAKQMQAPIFWAEASKFNVPFHFPENSYQWINERTVRTAIEVLDLNFTEEDIRLGIQNLHENTGFRGRFEILQTSPLTVLDVAHNVDGIRQVLKTILPMNQGNMHIVYGTSSDKDLTQIISLFPSDAQFYLTPFTNERSAKLEDLKQISHQLQLQSQFFTHVKEAYTAAQHAANKKDTILITGSFFLISDFFEKN